MIIQSHRGLVALCHPRSPVERSRFTMIRPPNSLALRSRSTTQFGRARGTHLTLITHLSVNLRNYTRRPLRYLL